MRSRLSQTAVLSLVLILNLSLLSIRALAEEGMFLPDTINTLPVNQLKKRGLEIPVSEIYNPTGISIKDAVVIVDGGTGEFVSSDGLLLTNHHVAFDALVAASDKSHDYATNGYMAHLRTEELPAKNYTVTITQDLKDVTSQILTGIKEPSSASERAAAIADRISSLEAASSRAADGVQVRILPMAEGLSYYQFTYFVLRDVRIVYAPPKAIGFFGGDPDNFEWPRHCGDFTFMRAYVGANGKPADYSSANVPFKPKKFLALSLDGVHEHEFMMVLGYPGSTRRYRESYSVAYNQDIGLPFLADIFGKQIEILEDAGKNDPELRIKLQGTIFELSNSLKDFQGSVLAMRHAKLLEKKRMQEAAFTKWIGESPARTAKYGAVLPSLEKAYQQLNATASQDLVVQQLVSTTGLLDIASFAEMLAAEKEKPEAERNAALLSAANMQRAESRIAAVFSVRNPTVERGLLTFLLRKAAELSPEQKLQVIEKRFGGLTDEARRRAEEDFARAVVDSPRFKTPEALSSILKMSAAQLKELHEPLLEFALEIDELSQAARARTQTFNTTVARWRPQLLEGISEMQQTKPYPDANRTLRFSYGEVKGYVPREAITYTPFSTLAGVIEKDTGHEPFNVPEKLKQLFQTHDFGQYSSDGLNVPVDFLSTTDIIGGNSGSPIMNGHGDQVGIIFDGNYEGLGNDFFYNEEKGRAIAVDIRYVLFLTAKFGGADYILKELDLRGAGGKKRNA